MMKKTMTILTAAAMLTGIFEAFPVQAAETAGFVTRSEEEIQAYIAAHPFPRKEPDRYVTNPDITAYTVGEMDDAAQNRALNALNVMRYIAGLSEVELNAEYTYASSAAALINCVNNKLSHTPVQPEGFPDDLYQIAYDGAQSTNIFGGYGCYNAAESIVSFLYDSRSSNLKSVGHRRWCLNPTMKSTAFGGAYAPMDPDEVKQEGYDFNAQTYYYYTMYVMNSVEKSSQSVSWPAQNMPVEYFTVDEAWSFSNGKAFPDNTSVTLTRKNDGKVWKFSSSAADGHFVINNNICGQEGCLIFRPDDIEGYAYGDVFTVEIKGIEQPVTYTVSFFQGQDWDSAEENFVTEEYSDYVEILRYNDTSAHVEVPAEINGKPVRDISGRAFFDTTVTDIILTESIESIYFPGFVLADNLQTVTILNPDCYIDDYDELFPENVVIEGLKGSTAEKWAAEYGREFIEIETPEIVYETGDVTMDGNLNVADIVALQKHLLGLTALSEKQAELADVYSDTQINAFDLAALKNILLAANRR